MTAPATQVPSDWPPQGDAAPTPRTETKEPSDRPPQGDAVLPPGLRAAVQALSSGWHLAVLSGPDQGLVLPVPAGARTTVGRGEVLTDPFLSRHHLDLRATGRSVTLSRPPSAPAVLVRRRRHVRWRRPARPLLLGHGDRIRAGSSVLELRGRPTRLSPARPRPPLRGAVSAVATAATVLVSVVIGVLLALRVRAAGSGLPPLALATAVPMLLLTLLRVVGGSLPAAWTRTAEPGSGWSRQRPDAATMLLAVARQRVSPRRAPDDPGRTRPIAAWLGARRRRWVLRLPWGEHVGLTGPHAAAWVCWWCAQVAATGQARLVPLESTQTGPPHVRVLPTDAAGAGRAEAASLAAVDGDRLPAHVSHLRAAPRRAAPFSASWEQAVWAALRPPPGGQEAHDGAVATPERVRLEEVAGRLERDRVIRAWRATQDRQDGDGDGLPAVIGVGARGAQTVDLARHGPHALVAGTTGAGKSELLTSWVLQMTATTPPCHLSLVLVDYKGGAAFGPLARLPHTAGVLTDLDPALTSRALGSLLAEVARRERLLSDHRAKDLSHLPPGVRPARVVIIVDEFAVLAQDHPEVLAGLVRVAAQGRSLGLHLILATQRPAGSVSPEVRANTSVRVCLRVLDEADSRDVIGCADAAHLPSRPGALLLLRPDQPPCAAQAPWSGSQEEVGRAVDAIGEAARASGTHAPWRPWAPPLPSRLTRGELTARSGTGPTADGALRVPLALRDEPAGQRTSVWAWDTRRPLLVLGSPGSGRTTTLASAASGYVHALACRSAGGAGNGESVRDEPGVHLCCLGGAAACWPALREGAEGVGTVVGTQDPRRLARLWELALAGRLAGSLLVVDGVSQAVAAVDRLLGAGEGLARWESLLRVCPEVGTALIVSEPLAGAGARWCQSVPERLVLGARDPTQAAVAGLARDQRCGPGAGRGILTGADGSHCQVCLPDEGEHGRGRPLRLEPLPLPGPRAGRDGQQAWAVGGDDARALAPPTGAVLVAGPPGSGRTTALAALARACGTQRRPPLVVDDLDQAPASVRTQVEQALTEGRQVLASATASSAASAYQGALGALRAQADLVVLWPYLAAATALTTVDLRPACDPVHPVTPGRGVLVRRGRAVPLQVLAAGASEQGIALV